MKMKYNFLLLLSSLFLITNCNKEKNGCWQAYSPMGYNIQGIKICDKSREEAEAAYPQFWFYREGEPVYCWKLQRGSSIFYSDSVPVSMILLHTTLQGYQGDRIDCSSYCRCEWIEKHRSKITGLYNPTRMQAEIFLSADTCSKLYVGRVIVYRETADSIITRELRSKKP